MKLQTVSVLGLLAEVVIPLCHLDLLPLRLRLKFQKERIDKWTNNRYET